MAKFPYQIPEENKHAMKTSISRKEIIEEFQSIINRYSLENDSNTPDFILAEYLFDCLITGHLLICKRTMWYNPDGK